MALRAGTVKCSSPPVLFLCANVFAAAPGGVAIMDENGGVALEWMRSAHNTCVSCVIFAAAGSICFARFLLLISP
jgi:hypothetical protein